MKIDRIDVQTSNKKHATDIALLVEQDEFLSELLKLREKWHITKLKQLETSPFQELLNIDNVILKEITGKEEQQKIRNEFNKDIAGVLKKFNKSKNFTSVVVYALVTGTVPEGVYQGCYFDVVAINEPEDLSKPENFQYVIVMSPRTELKEVKQAYKDFKEHIKGKIQFESRSLPKLKENENLITNDEAKELGELLARIEIGYRQYRKNIKNATITDTVGEHAKFAKDIEGMIKKIELLRSKIPLDSNNPTDADLIEQFHRGDVHTNDDIDKHGTLKQFHRNREFFLIAYKDVLEGKAKEPLTPAQVYKEWQKKCPLNGHLKVKDQVDCSCQYCTLFEVNTIEKGIPAYIEFLKKLN